MFENGNINRGCLVGDSAYPLKNHLLTPVLNPSNPHEEAYKDAHAKTRAPIERAFGVLKMRFRCIDRSGGTLLFRPERACRIVTACVVLHNICINNNVPVPRNRNNYRIFQQSDNVIFQGVNNDGAEVRRRLIQTRFWELSNCHLFFEYCVHSNFIKISKLFLLLYILVMIEW